MEQPRVLQKYRSEIDAALGQFFNKEIRKASRLGHPVREALQIMRDFTLRGGKRLRPMLVILGFKGAGGKGLKEIIRVSLSYELMQSYFLIHDDIIDQDDLRRGEKTAHKEFEARYKDGPRSKKKESCAHHGESMAIIAGDICSSMGSQAILGSSFPLKRRVAAARLYHEIAIGTLYGEILDCSTIISEEEIRRVHGLKTALYTFEGPLRMGAILAGGDRSVKAAYAKYARNLGLAFQIQDDILGVFGDEKAVGKPVGSDLKEGKHTLLILHALDHAKPDEKAFLEAILGKKDITQQQISETQRILRDCGALRHSQELAITLVTRAKRALWKADIGRETIRCLLWLADFTVSRRF